MQILEELYLNHAQHRQKSLRHNEQYTEALKRSAESEDALVNALSEEQKKLFQAYAQDQQDLAVITDCETFIHGFKLGAKIMLDVLTVSEINEI